MNEQLKFPAGTAFGSIGHPIRRKEDQRLLTGKGRYTDDFSLPGQTYAATSYDWCPEQGAAVVALVRRLRLHEQGPASATAPRYFR